MLATLKELCALSGVTGDECEVREFIKQRVISLSEEIIEDSMGNLIVFVRGRKRAKKRVMLCAHMDEVGVIATGITDSGYVRFACAGGIDKRVLPGKIVQFAETAGVIGVKAPHLQGTSEREKATKIDELLIDIGAHDRAHAESLIALGDLGTFDARAFEFGGGLLKSKAIDDRLGCAVMLELIANTPPMDCWFAFTVQEEVGTRGAQIASFRVAPDVALIVEATTAADIPGATEEKRVCELGKGAVIPFMDGGTIYDRDLYKMLNKLADSNGIKWQTKTVISGGTDAAAVQRSRGGVQTAALAAPIRNLHSPSCVGDISDFEAVLKLAELFLEAIGDE
ncbi:MAG: M42 family peptidase [Oscillospiraceae bacterium]|jgi:endoglucanase|nr:M42 family peptidase [Oscillospiraceae bacterium]